MIPLRKNKQVHSAGIYMIEAENSKRYVGSTMNISKRVFKQHLASLKNRKHYNKYLQNHFNKYGEQDLWFEILEYVHKEVKETIEEYKARLLSREQYWIDYYDSSNRKKGFNITPTAGSCLGRIQSEKEKELRRSIWSDETFKLQVSVTMKKSHADFKGKNHPNYGKKYNIQNRITDHETYQKDYQKEYRKTHKKEMHEYYIKSLEKNSRSQYMNNI